MYDRYACVRFQVQEHVSKKTSVATCSTHAAALLTSNSGCNSKEHNIAKIWFQTCTQTSQAALVTSNSGCSLKKHNVAKIWFQTCTRLNPNHQHPVCTQRPDTQLTLTHVHRATMYPAAPQLSAPQPDVAHERRRFKQPPALRLCTPQQQCRGSLRA